MTAGAPARGDGPDRDGPAKHRILVIQPLRPEALALFDARDDVVHELVTDVTAENLGRLMVDADAVTLRTAPLPVEALERATRLKVISRHGVGVDNIPVDYCTERGIAVTVVGAVNAVSVAEQTMFLILAAARSGVELDRAVRRGDFDARSRVTGLQLHGRTLLIAGLGRIGREVARRALAFGMKVAAFDPYVGAGAVAGVAMRDTLEAGLREADVLSLHLPLTDATRTLIGAAELDLMPRGAILVNAARGGLVDEAALAERVRDGRLGGAGLDVFEREPPAPDSPLLAEEKIVVSPHSASLTRDCLIAMGEATARNALAGIDGTLAPELVVNRSVLEDKGP